MFSTSAFVVFLAVFSQTSSDRYVYVVQKAPRKITCKEGPAKDVCMYKVPNYHAESGRTLVGNTTFTSSVDSVLSTWRLVLRKQISEKCTNAVTDYFCLSYFPVCDESDDYIEIVGQKIIDACNKILANCTAVGLQTVSAFFNCSSLTKTKIAKGLVCSDFTPVQNDAQYSCSVGMYNEQYPEMLVKNESHVNELARLHKKIETNSNLDTACRKKIDKLICNIGLPACTKDKEYVVSFVNQEECEEIINCIKDSNLKTEAAMWCSGLPDTNAKNISYTDAFGKGTSKGTSQESQIFSSVLLLFFIVVLF